MSVSTPRRTLPAPSEPANFELLIAERDRLRTENALLRERLEARESAARESVALLAEVSHLRLALARLRPEEPTSERKAIVSRQAPLPPLWKDEPLFEASEIPTGNSIARAPEPDTGLDFGTVSRLSPNELDQLPYGLICLDAQGRVVHYNDTESRLARLPKERVLGRNFFSEVAPCTRIRDFEGQFFDLVRDASRVRVRTFDFVFRFAHSEQHVTIVITPARQRGLYNMALLRRNVVNKERA